MIYSFKKGQIFSGYIYGSLAGSLTYGQGQT